MSSPNYVTPATRVCLDTDPEWLDERMLGIGASEAAAVMGRSTFAGPAKIAAQKLGYDLGFDEESELLKWGKRSEKPLLEWFREQTEIECELNGVLWRTNDPNRLFMQATLDGRCMEKGEPGGIECKLARYTAKEWEETGVPDQVQIQTQHQMSVMEWGFAYVLVLLDGYRPRWSRMERDDKFIDDEMIPAERDFWERLQAGVPIAPMGAPDHEYTAIKAMFPNTVEGKTIKLEGEEWIHVYEQWKEYTAERGVADKAAKALRNTLMAAVGDAQTAYLDDGHILTLNEQTRAAHEVGESHFRVLRGKGGPK